MQTAIDRLLRTILETQRVLGEAMFPLSPKVLSDFLKNERAVLAEADLEAGEAVSSMENQGKRARDEDDGEHSFLANNFTKEEESQRSLAVERVAVEVRNNIDDIELSMDNPEQKAMMHESVTSAENTVEVNIRQVAHSVSTGNEREDFHGSSSALVSELPKQQTVFTGEASIPAVKRGAADDVEPKGTVGANAEQSTKRVLSSSFSPSFSDASCRIKSSDGSYDAPIILTIPDGAKAERWQWLKEKVLSCPNCLQHVPEGKRPVFGSGNLDADIFFCGEAPGAEEEEQCEVFVGRAGQLLTKIIEAMGLQRSDVYISNIMNWRPETPNRIGNRPPTPEEMRFCLPYLIGQVEIVRPKLIVALGLTAANGLLGYDAQRRMRDCRGHWFEFHRIPLTVTYHPSYLLRNATSVAKRMVWEDMLGVMRFLKMPISEKQEGYFL